MATLHCGIGSGEGAVLLHAHSDPLAAPDHVERTLLLVEGAVEIHRVAPPLIIIELRVLVNVPDGLPLPVLSREFELFFG